MNAAAAIRSITMSLLVALATGCVPLPASTFATAPRFSEQQLAEAGRQPQTRDSVASLLGPADLQRADGRIWIYTWTEDFGAWELVPVSGHWSDNRVGPVESHRFLWVFEFDDQGTMLSQEHVRDAKETSRGAYCTAGGVCIHHYRWVNDAEFGLRKQFDDWRSAVTVRDEARRRLGSPEPRPDQCLVVLWPEKVWDSLVGPTSDDGGVAFRIDGSSSSSEWHWLPTGAFVRLVLPPGEHALSVRDRSEDDANPRSSTRPFHCDAGEPLYLALGGSEKDSNHFPLDLRSLETGEGLAAISGLSLLLLTSPHP